MPAAPSFNVDDLDSEQPEEEEEELEEPEPVGVAAVPTPGPTRVAKPKTRAGRVQFNPRKPPDSAQWAEADAEALWPEVLSTLGKTGHAYQQNSAYDFEMRVVRISPPPKETVNRFDCSALQGDGSINPGDLLVRMVDDYCHLPTPTLGECKYECNIVWKAGRLAGRRIARGILVRPPAQEIIARRNAGTPPRFAGAPYYAPPQPTQPQYYPSPAAYPPAAAGTDRYLLEQLVHQLNSTRGELATLRGQPPPPPIAAPAPPPISEDSIVEKLFQKVAPMLGRAAGAGFGAAAGVPAGSKLEAMMGNFLGQALEATLNTVTSRFQASLKGEPMGAADEPVAAAAEVVAENPEDSLPFTAVKLGGKWGDGRDVYYTASKDGKGPFGTHLGGFAACNPFVIEKFAEVASGGVQRITNAVAGVVERMTSGAIVGGVPAMGVGQQPQHPQVTIDTTATEAPPPPPPPAYVPPTVPNGQSGWPQA
jgi:hypothetical protein